MQNIWTIARREYKVYFNSPIAYVISLLILLVLGIMFFINILFFALNTSQNYGSAPDISMITGPFAFMLVLSLPALTMRLVSEEHRMGTMELLLTAPLRDWELVVGKWLGSFLFMLTLIGFTLLFPIILNFMVNPGIDQGLMMSGYLGIILVSAAFLGIGVGISAMFTNQFAAFFATLITFVVLWWMIGFPAEVLPAGAEVFRYLDMKTHFYDTLNAGVINLSDIIYFLSLTALGLFTGSISIESRRWR